MLRARLRVIFHPHPPLHVDTGLPQSWASSPSWPLAWQTAPCSFIGAWRPLTLPGPRRWNVGGLSAPLALQSLARKSSCCTHTLRAWAVPGIHPDKCAYSRCVHQSCSRCACSEYPYSSVCFWCGCCMCVIFPGTLYVTGETARYSCTRQGGWVVYSCPSWGYQCSSIPEAQHEVRIRS